MSDGQTFIGMKEDTLINFRGIRYAKPPVCDLRWKTPVLFTQYDDVVNGTANGFACATFNTQDDPYKHDPPQSEDCLTVNIQVAEWVLQGRNKVPIVAYIHGGSFNFGNNDKPNLKPLATNGLMSFHINYRLGPYGFLYLDELEPGQQYKGNWGLQDQLAALKWINMFGGVFGSVLKFWVVLGRFGWVWLSLGEFGPFWLSLGRFGSFGSFWVVSSFSPYRYIKELVNAL